MGSPGPGRGGQAPGVPGAGHPPHPHGGRRGGLEPAGRDRLSATAPPAMISAGRGARPGCHREGHRPGSVADQPGRGVLHPLPAPVDGPVDVVRPPAVVGELPAGRALGYHGADPGSPRPRPGPAHRPWTRPARRSCRCMPGCAARNDTAAARSRPPHQPKSIECPPDSPCPRPSTSSAPKPCRASTAAWPSTAARVDPRRAAAPRRRRCAPDVPGRQPHPVGGAERHIPVGEPVLRGGADAGAPGGRLVAWTA